MNKLEYSKTARIPVAGLSHNHEATTNLDNNGTLTRCLPAQSINLHKPFMLHRATSHNV